MNVLVVAQYSDVPHVTGFAIKWMSKRYLYRVLQWISLTRIAVNPAARRKRSILTKLQYVTVCIASRCGLKSGLDTQSRRFEDSGCGRKNYGKHQP
jgi:hypothetical protein